MGELDHYSRLVGDVYELSGDPRQWGILLEGVTRFIDGRVGQLAVFSLKQQTKPTWRVWGHDHNDYKPGTPSLTQMSRKSLWMKLYSRMERP